MKHILITTIAAVLVVGCGNPEADRALRDAAEEGMRGNIKAVKQHLAAGADVNSKSKHGRTPLHAAAVGGSKEIVELLLAKGANVNATFKAGATLGGGGETPLDVAIELKRTETADLLRKHGGKTKKELEAAGN